MKAHFGVLIFNPFFKSSIKAICFTDGTGWNILRCVANIYIFTDFDNPLSDLMICIDCL